MNTWARKSFKVGVLSAGVLLFAGTAANASDFNSVGNTGLLNGNQIGSTIQAPIDVCGNAVAVLGAANAACVGGSWASIGDDHTTLNSFGNTGLGNGNQLNSVIQAPIDVCGNAVGVAGAAWAECVGGSSASIGGGNGGNMGGGYYSAAKSHAAKSHAKKANTESGHALESTTLNSFGNVGAANGNQLNSVIQVPIDVCGNAIGVLGAAQASCVGGASATTGGGNSGSGTTMNSGFNAGFLNGNQANSVIQVPIDVCGNAIGVLGSAQASCVGGASATTGGGNSGNGGNGGGYGGGNYGGGNYGGGNYGGGNYGGPGASTNTGTNESTMAKPAGMHPGYQHSHSSNGGNACSPTLNSFGNVGLLNGNQLNSVIQAPVEISGNAIGVLGAAQAYSVGGAWASC